MDFAISEQTQTMLTMIDAFVEKELFPVERLFLTKDFRELLPLLEDKRARVRQMGLWAPCHPTAYGGMGLNLVDFGLVSEALGRSPLGHYVFGCQAPDAGNVEILAKYGTDEQRQRWLVPLVDGKIRSCFSMTEVEMPGSNPLMLEATAVKDGADYVLNGQKWYSTGADGAAFSIVMAVTNPDAPPYLRASMIIVPTETPGFDRVRNVSVMGHAGSDYFSHAEVLLHSCRVPAKNLLGAEGAGFVIAQERLGPGRIYHCMRWLGICRRALDLLCERASRRAISPDGRTLATKQIIQAWIAECAAEIEAAKMLVLRTAWVIDQRGAEQARVEVSLIKFYVAGVLQKVVDRALQVHGGLGMTDDTILAFFYRHERAARIYDGADEVHKVSAAKQLLRRFEKPGR